MLVRRFIHERNATLHGDGIQKSQKGELGLHVSKSEHPLRLPSQSIKRIDYNSWSKPLEVHEYLILSLLSNTTNNASFVLLNKELWLFKWWVPGRLAATWGFLWFQYWWPFTKPIFRNSMLHSHPTWSHVPSINYMCPYIKKFTIKFSGKLRLY